MSDVLATIREFFSRQRQRIFESLFRLGYRSLVSNGEWRQALIEVTAPAAGERILEVCTSVGSVCSDLAARYPDVRVSNVQPHSAFGQALPKVERLNSVDGRFDCPPSSFDKAICTLALHALPTAEKLRLLKEIRRVLRQNGVLYLLDLDQGQRAVESVFLRSAVSLYGVDSTESHLNGSWINVIAHAGFTSIKRLETYSITVGRIALVRARRA